MQEVVLTYKAERCMVIHEQEGTNKKQVLVNLSLTKDFPDFGAGGNTRSQNILTPFYKNVKDTFINNERVTFFNPPLFVWAQDVKLLSNGLVESRHFKSDKKSETDGCFDGRHRGEILNEIIKENQLTGKRNILVIFYVGYHPIHDKEERIKIAVAHNKKTLNTEYSINDAQGWYDDFKTVLDPLNIPIQYSQNQIKKSQLHLNIEDLIYFLTPFMSGLFAKPSDRHYWESDFPGKRIQYVFRKTECNEFYLQNMSAYKEASHLFPQMLELAEMIRFEGATWLFDAHCCIFPPEHGSNKNFDSQKAMFSTVQSCQGPVYYKVSDETLAVRNSRKRNWQALSPKLLFLLVASFRFLIKDGNWIADFNEIKAFVQQTAPDLLSTIRNRANRSIELIDVEKYLRQDTRPTSKGDDRLVRSPWESLYQDASEKWAEWGTLATARGIASPSKVLIRRAETQMTV